MIIVIFATEHIFAQDIPYGTSVDSIIVDVPENGQYYGDAYNFHLYKPTNYDNVNSPILLYIHGSGGDGSEGINILSDIADRNKALIVSPTMHSGIGGWSYVITAYTDTVTGIGYTFWSTAILKQIYRNILEREDRDSIPVYITGFSQGGQFVTRYMLVRQFDPDSIPIVMSASVDPANYTLCTDTFNGTEMDWTWYRCGLAGHSPVAYYPPWTYIPVNQLICNSHVKQYYNENYAVLIGTNDTVDFPGFCPNQGGDDRYERAIAFYNFSDTNAVNRGTTLQWQYAEIPDIGHDGYALYNTVAAGDSIPIAERILFETPWHPVPDFSPVADFSYVDTGLMVHFTDLTENVGNFWYWDFGDGDTSIVQNPQHSFASSGTYYVCLTAGDSCITDIYCDSISVTSVGINSSDEISNLKVYPNPCSNTATIELTDDSRRIDIDFTVYDQIGREVKTYKLNKPKTIINSNDFKKGIYYYEAHNNYNYKIYRGKLLIID